MVDWANGRGILLEVIEAEDLSPDDLHDFDSLVVMGGPMSVHDRDRDPQIAAVMDAIGEAFRAGKPILGICLGAQMLAMVTGGDVVPGHQKEIGWYPVELHSARGSSFPDETGLTER